MSKLSLQDATLLAAALEGLEMQRARIEKQIRDVKSMLGKRGARMAAEANTVPLPNVGKPHHISKAGRRRIAAAQKKRWAKFHRAKGNKS